MPFNIKIKVSGQNLKYSALTLIIVFLLFNPYFARSEPLPMLPFAPSPYTQLGGAVQGEFQRRYLDKDLTYLRRGALILGWSPYKNFSFWSEFGLISLQILSNNEPTGDFGPSIGLGLVLNCKKPILRYLIPLITARAIQNQSKLSDEQHTTNQLSTYRYSRFDWQEGWGLIGVSSYIKGGLLFGGVTLRKLLLDERRKLRTGSAIQESRYTYDSGFKPGFGFGMRFNTYYRLNICAFAEYFDKGAKITINVGQWGKP